MHLTVLTDSVGLVKFGGEVIKRNKSVVEEVEAVLKKVSDKKAAWQRVEKEFTRLKCSVSGLTRLLQS